MRWLLVWARDADAGERVCRSQADGESSLAVPRRHPARARGRRDYFVPETMTTRGDRDMGRAPDRDAAVAGARRRDGGWGGVGRRRRSRRLAGRRHAVSLGGRRLRRRDGARGFRVPRRELHRRPRGLGLPDRRPGSRRGHAGPSRRLRGRVLPEARGGRRRPHRGRHQEPDVAGGVRPAVPRPRDDRRRGSAAASRSTRTRAAATPTWSSTSTRGACRPSTRAGTGSIRSSASRRSSV